MSGIEKAKHRRAGKLSDSAKGEMHKRKKGKSSSGPIGRALRSVYDDTLREDVPTDFLDLLGKLG